MAKVTFVLNSTNAQDVQANAQSFDDLEYYKDPNRGGLTVTDASRNPAFAKDAVPTELIITLKNIPTAAAPRSMSAPTAPGKKTAKKRN